MEQGLGLGTGSQLFNRATASATRILRLNKDTPEYSKAPVTLVGHAKLGVSLGELPAYEAFLLGGPQSVGIPADPDQGQSGRCREPCTALPILFLWSRMGVWLSLSEPGGACQAGGQPGEAHCLRGLPAGRAPVGRHPS